MIEFEYNQLISLVELDGLGHGEDLSGEAGLGHVDLALTVGEIDINTAADLLAVGGGVEDVADGVAVVEGGVRDLALLRATVVGQCDEELTARESEEA